MVKYNLAEFGRAYISMHIKPINDTTMRPISFKVDTGADKTTISRYHLFLLGYGAEWLKQNVVMYEDKEKPTTASGEKISAGYVQLPLINILGYEGKNWSFQVILDEKHDFRNLLGRDLLTGFNYSFDNDADVFSISRTKTFKPRYEFLPNQEIHELHVQ
jgi:predicted aspartyl protease